MNEDELRNELAAIRAEQRQLGQRASRLQDMLDGPRVTPLLCFWQHHSYREEEAVNGTVDDAFGELDGMEEYGTASTVGVRVGGYLITYTEHGGEPRLLWDDDEKIRRSTEEARHQLIARKGR